MGSWRPLSMCVSISHIPITLPGEGYAGLNLTFSIHKASRFAKIYKCEGLGLGHPNPPHRLPSSAMLFPLALFASIASSALALVHGVDSSTLVSETAYAKAMSEGFTKAIIRGYEEACSVVSRMSPFYC